MYHPAQIGKLSPAQISKLLNGHSVRVKHGSGHQVHLSKEQHKKLHKAEIKGSGVNLTFDPYQVHNHQHLREKSTSGGSTYAQRLARRTRNTFKPVARALEPLSHELMNVGRDVSHQLMNTGRTGIRTIGAKVSDSIAGFNEQIPTMVDAGAAYAVGGSTYAQRLARRTRNTFKPVARALEPLSHELMNVGRDVSHQLMNTGRTGIRTIGAKVSDSIAGFNDQIPTMVDAGAAYAMGAGVGKRRVRVRGRGVKGGALIAAGY